MRQQHQMTNATVSDSGVSLRRIVRRIRRHAWQFVAAADDARPAGARATREASMPVKKSTFDQ
jgi:hypothetical protein